MKKLILLAVFMALLSVLAQKPPSYYRWEMKSKTNKFVIKFGRNNNQCDTLFLNGKKHYVMMESGYTSCMGIGGKKWEYTITHLYFQNPENGRRVINNQYSDRFDLFLSQDEKRIIKAVRYSDGIYVKTYY